MTVKIQNKYFLFFFFVIHIQSISAQSKGQDNPVITPHAKVIPVIDGKGDDACWQNVKWQPINQVWIPYGTPLVDSNDFNGKFKVVWSSKTNLLYFLIEVHDDVFVDGYVPNVTADLYNFDIAEVFLDENASGGLHLFDGTGSVGKEWGTNAQNAFTYHMYADFPKAGEVTTKPYVSDVAGTSWADAHFPNNASHLPQFALRKTGNTAVWEFSLIVYNDTYKENNKDASRVKLTPGKVMGMTVAYCDNDSVNENPKVRDSMFGSVPEPSPGNLHWMNADYFGRMKLGAIDSPLTK
jgi:hypothetical protein